MERRRRGGDRERVEKRKREGKTHTESNQSLGAAWTHLFLMGGGVGGVDGWRGLQPEPSQEEKARREGGRSASSCI